MQEMLGFDFGFHIFWMWLNVTGFVLTLAIAYGVSALGKAPEKALPSIDFQLKKSDFLAKESLILMGFFVVILVFSFMVPAIF
ncbi:MAG: hypothetical protein R3B47_15435 [Bacteroidia bacterium]